MPKIALTNYVLIISAVWLVVALCLGWSAQAPEGCSGTFSCLAANEWGDYLAGVFAPLAFFWLVAAVFVQSKELAEQREELKLTRGEFQHNREVMQAQADEARRQAEFIGLQTDILKRQDEGRQREAIQAEFEATLNEMENVIRQRLNLKRSLVRWEGESPDYWTLGYEASSRDDIIIAFHEYLLPVPDSGPRPISIVEGFEEDYKIMRTLVASAIEHGLSSGRSSAVLRLRLNPILQEIDDRFVDTSEAGKQRIATLLDNTQNP